MRPGFDTDPVSPVDTCVVSVDTLNLLTATVIMDLKLDTGITFSFRIPVLRNHWGTSWLGSPIPHMFVTHDPIMLLTFSMLEVVKGGEGRRKGGRGRKWRKERRRKGRFPLSNVYWNENENFSTRVSCYRSSSLSSAVFLVSVSGYGDTSASHLLRRQRPVGQHLFRRGLSNVYVQPPAGCERCVGGV